jgi:hypothetical protein
MAVICLDRQERACGAVSGSHSRRHGRGVHASRLSGASIDWLESESPLNPLVLRIVLARNRCPSPIFTGDKFLRTMLYRTPRPRGLQSGFLGAIAIFSVASSPTHGRIRRVSPDKGPQ